MRGEDHKRDACGSGGFNHRVVGGDANHGQNAAASTQNTVAKPLNYR